ncbi:MAG TPA: CU044_5270 family protein [Streptosporangiaceae bacterium]|jgi:hypothetical protein|nr:CU044_5270 family protein [Streptosporangiaceae bacterium]
MSTRPALIGFETRLLAELRQVVAERATAAHSATAPHPDAAPGPSASHPAAPHPPARGQAGRGWPHRRLAMTGGLSAAVAAGLAVALSVTLPGSGGPPAGPAAPRFAPATTVAAVLDNAALAAQSEPAVTPRPDQFVYSKIVTGGPHSRESTESWISVSGARKGLSVSITRNGNQPARTSRGPASWCENGFVDGQSKINGKPGPRCTPRDFAAYKPWLPSTTAGMLAFLAREAFHANPRRDGGTMVDIAFWLLSRTALAPAQQAATFRALAGLPHLHVVKGVTDALGRTGIGIAYNGHGESWTTIFDPRTFRTMGAVFTNRAGAQRWAVAGLATVVDRVGQRP